MRRLLNQEQHRIIIISGSFNCCLLQTFLDGSRQLLDHFGQALIQQRGTLEVLVQNGTKALQSRVNVWIVSFVGRRQSSDASKGLVSFGKEDQLRRGRALVAFLLLFLLRHASMYL